MRAHEKGLELIQHVQPDAPDALAGDAGRLRQILLNLVGNAIKFTETGEVVVRVETVDRPTLESEVGLSFTVLDTGIGIPREKKASIFRAFEQEDTSTTRRYGGTGLGLTIAARLVALMGGTITVDSQPGRGSSFALTARFRRQPHCQEPPSVLPPPSLHDLPVLVVDDNATNRHILAEWLHGWKMQPSEVGGATAALATLRQAAALGRPFPLVLLDARMPDVDGVTAAAQIRAVVELAATRIVLLTSGKPARTDELQIDAHLLKPVMQRELLETICRVFQTHERRECQDETAKAKVSVDHRREPASSLAPHPSPLRVLVAEDNEFNAQLLEQLLRRGGHQVRMASDGREALRLADDGRFDLLLLDIHMPELDGFQVAETIRARERMTGTHLPIIALTARSRKEDRERCLAAGMDDFLAKPIQAVNLWEAIDRNVHSRQNADRIETAVLSPDAILAACGGDSIILEKITQTFRARLPAHLDAIQNGLRDGDLPRLREAAHKLSGMVAVFSTVAGELASELEDHAAQGQLEKAESLVRRLDAIARELLRLLDGLSIDTLRKAISHLRPVMNERTME